MAARIGHVCRAERERMPGLRMLDIASHVGLSESTVSNFERGRAFSPHMDALVGAYAHFLPFTERQLWQKALDLPDDF